MCTERELIIHALRSIAQQFMIIYMLPLEYRTSALYFYINDIEDFIEIEPSEYAKILTKQDVIDIISQISSLSNITVIDPSIQNIVVPMRKVRDHLNGVLSIYM